MNGPESLAVLMFIWVVGLWMGYEFGLSARSHAERFIAAVAHARKQSHQIIEQAKREMTELGGQ